MVARIDVTLLMSVQDYMYDMMHCVYSTIIMQCLYFVYVCRYQIYNQALLLNYDCEAKDALIYVERELEEMYAEASAETNRIEQWLYTMFTRMKPDFFL